MIQGADGRGLRNRRRRQAGTLARDEGQVEAARRSRVQANQAAVAEGGLLAQGGQAPASGQTHGGVELGHLQDNQLAGVALAAGAQAQGHVGQGKDAGRSAFELALPCRLPTQEDAVAGGGVLDVVDRDDHMVEAEDHLR